MFIAIALKKFKKKNKKSLNHFNIKNISDYFLRLQNDLLEGKKINQNSMLFDLSNDIEKNTEKEKNAIKSLTERLNIFKSKNLQDALEYIEAEKTLKNK